jgi:hypothetical protein
MRKRRVDWVDRRLRQTTILGESSALVANDIIANMPDDSACRQVTLVIEVEGGHVWNVYCRHPPGMTVILVDHDEAERNPGKGALKIDASPLSAMGNECKALMLDAGQRLSQES